MAKRKKSKDPIPESFASLEEAAEFWDTHDSGDYWEYTKPAHFDVKLEKHPRYLAMDRSVARKLARAAKKRKVPANVLGNLLLQERLMKINA